MERALLDKISKSVIAGEPELAEKYTKGAIKAGISPATIITRGLTEGLRVAEKKWEKKEFFTSDLIMSAEAAKAGLSLVRPLLRRERAEFKGRVVIGSVKGNPHEIGKMVVSAMLEAAEFEIFDQGVDVQPEEFARKAKELNADVVAVGAYLSYTVPFLADVNFELKKVGMRDKVVYIVGGAATSEGTARSVGADGWAEDAVVAVKIVSDLLGKKR